MKALLTLLALVAVLPAKAATTDICDRTPEVRDAILKATSADDECTTVDLASVRMLFLDSKQLTSLKADDFAGLGGLELLNLQGNLLKTLPTGVFDGLGNLKYLYLHRNQFATLPDGVFDGLDSLVELDLRRNHLVGLTADDPLFDGLDDLYTLSLSEQAEPKP